MENRRDLNTQDRLKNLGNAIKTLRYKKADEEKLRSYIIEVLKLKNKKCQAKMEKEINENVFFPKKVM